MRFCCDKLELLLVPIPVWYLWEIQFEKAPFSTFRLTRMLESKPDVLIKAKNNKYAGGPPEQGIEGISWNSRTIHNNVQQTTKSEMRGFFPFSEILNSITVLCSRYLRLFKWNQSQSVTLSRSLAPLQGCQRQVCPSVPIAGDGLFWQKEQVPSKFQDLKCQQWPQVLGGQLHAFISLLSADTPATHIQWRILSSESTKIISFCLLPHDFVTF